jgi:hypothetical protein
MKPKLSDADAEAMCDRIVQRRLATDSAYRNAEDAESQATREQDITDEVWADIEARYELM